MKEFEVILYDKPDGSIPVSEFVGALPEKLRAKTLRELELLAYYGNEPRGVSSKMLEDGIHEMRVKQSSDIVRVLYFFKVGKKIILTNGFVKKTQKTPRNEIERAKKYRVEYLSREELE